MGQRPKYKTKEEKLAQRRKYYALNRDKIAAQEKARREKRKAEGTYVPPKVKPKPPGFKVDIRQNPDFDQIVQAIAEEDLERAV